MPGSPQTQDPVVATLLGNAAIASTQEEVNDKYVADLLRSLSSGNIPDNFNVQALVDNYERSQESLTTQALQTQELLAGVLIRSEQDAQGIRDLRSRISTENANAAEAQNILQADQSAYEEAAIANVGKIHQELESKIVAHDAEIATNEAVFKSVKDRMLAGYEAIDAHNNKSFIDLIKDPKGFIDSYSAAAEAQTQVVNDRMLASDLAAIQQYEAAAMQSSSAMALTRADLQNSEMTAARLRTSQSSAIANMANTAKAFTADMLDFDLKVLGIDDANAKNLVSSLNALSEQGRLGSPALNAAIQKAQLDSAIAQANEVKRLTDLGILVAADNEAVFQELKQAFPNIGFESYAQYTQNLENDNVDPDTKRIVTTFYGNRLLSATSALNTSNPHATAMALAANGSLPRGMADIATGIEMVQLADGSTLGSNQAYIQGTPQERAAMRDQTMTQFMTEIKQNANGLFTNRLPGVNLISPDAMDFTDGNMPPIPTAGIELIKKWHLDTTDYDRYLKGAMDEASALFVKATGGASLTSGQVMSPNELIGLVDTLSLTLAGLNQYYLNNAQSSLGVNLPGLNTKLLRFGGRDTQNRDATDPETWRYYLQATHIYRVANTPSLYNAFKADIDPRTVGKRRTR